MRNNKVLTTAIAAVLLGLSGASSASRLENLDYVKHGSAGCTATTIATTTTTTVNEVGAYQTGKTISEATNTVTTDTVSLGATSPATTTYGKACLPALTTAFPPSGMSGVIDSDATAGRAIAVETLSGSTVTLPSGEKISGTTTTPTPIYAGVVYYIDGTIVQDFDVTFELTGGASFDDEPRFGIWDGILGTEYTNFLLKSGSSGKGKSSVTYSVRPATDKRNLGGTTTNTPAKLYLLYNIQNATVLQQANGKVEMKAKIKMATGVGTSTDFEEQMVTIFTSANTLTDAEITSEDDGNVYISVEDESKLFTDNVDNTIPTNSATTGGFRDTMTARIGYLKVGQSAVFEPNGVELFKIGSGAGKAGAASELTIKGGQFAASASGLGKVQLRNTATGEIIATTTGSADGSEAIFKLDDTALGNLTKAATVAIEIVADTKNAINTVDAAPLATLSLVFDDNTIKVSEDFATKVTDIPVRRIYSNGITCWAFNLPSADLRDKFNIRITNESSVPGSITATLYSQGGGEGEVLELAGIGQLVTAKTAGTGTDDTTKNLLMPERTLYLDYDQLIKSGVAEWTGDRKVMRITSKLPKLEVLALLRNKELDDASNPLINLSLGAHGLSCEQGGQ